MAIKGKMTFMGGGVFRGFQQQGTFTPGTQAIDPQVNPTAAALQAQAQAMAGITSAGLPAFMGAPIPDVLTATYVSNTGMSAVNQTVFFGNEVNYQVTPTNNGSGAATLSKTYGDYKGDGTGYNSEFVINRQDIDANSGRVVGSYMGIKIYGFNIMFVITSGTVQDPTSLTPANVQVLKYTGIGTTAMPLPITIVRGRRNTMYLAGLLTIKTMFNFDAKTQVQFVVKPGVTATIELLTAPLEDAAAGN